MFDLSLMAKQKKKKTFLAKKIVLYSLIFTFILLNTYK